MRLAWNVARIGENINAYNTSIFVAKLQGKISIGRPRRRWVNNIRMDLKRDWIGSY
jgi:hypothetical protein